MKPNIDWNNKVEVLELVRYQNKKGKLNKNTSLDMSINTTVKTYNNSAMVFIFMEKADKIF